jgi:AAA-like domain
MRSVRASEAGLVKVDRARRRMRGWTKTRTESWWMEAEVSQSTLRRFWARKLIRENNFIAICKAVGLEDWEELVDRSELAEEQVSDLPLTEMKITADLTPPAVLAELPEGSVDLASAFYVERSSMDGRCYETIMQPGALIRIKAPRQMGKTSLLERICDRAEKKHYRTVRLNLSQAEERVFSTLDKFLRWFCTNISYKLKLSTSLKDYWNEDRGSIVNCTTYFQEQILEPLKTPLVLALDEVDWMFQRYEIAQGFFSMLRSWHEEAKIIDVWEQLRLVVVHSTEDYGRLDINQSPFNVGLSVEFTEFTSAQVEDLVKRHRLDWETGLVQQLMARVGGHPYLVRLALYHLAWQDVALAPLLQEAATDAGIYADHLRRHLQTLQARPELALALQQVVASSSPVRLETMQAYKLYSMGLVKRMGDRVSSRCQLYRDYFRERLG